MYVHLFNLRVMTKEERDTISLIHSQIAGCLRNEYSEYAVRLVFDLIKEYADQQTEELKKEVEELKAENITLVKKMGADAGLKASKIFNLKKQLKEKSEEMERFNKALCDNFIIRILRNTVSNAEWRRLIMTGILKKKNKR